MCAVCFGWGYGVHTETAEEWQRALEAQLLHALWRLPCDNRRKDTLWRLAFHGMDRAIMTSARGSHACVGGSVAVSRTHRGPA